MNHNYKAFWLKSQLIILLFLIVNVTISQEENLGLLYHNSSVSSGYVLFTPLQSNKAFLVDECGEKVNEWEFSELPGATCYLLENGNLLRAGKDSLEIRDWDNNIIWSYATTQNGIRQHHDIEPLPNGNILCVAGQSYDAQELIDIGKNPENIEDAMRMDKIIELQPGEIGQAEIVWEWKFIDHIIQDFDASKPNYGQIADYPERLNINYINSNNLDFTHVNAVDYNADLDQILISARHLNEIFIIDHSTTTEEAASHSGGNSGKGGDFLWRWGNVAGYDQGTEEDEKLVMQHDAKWVQEGFLDENKISVFNNGNDAIGISKLCLLEPVIENNEYQMENNVFLPLDYDWSWQGTVLGDTVYEKSRSGMMSLENGNIIFCETSKGRINEITKSGTLLWSYVNPVGPVVYNQYEDIPDVQIIIFRGEKYADNYPGFDGQNMEPGGIIEDINPNSEECQMLQSVNHPENNDLLIQNPVMDKRIHFSRDLYQVNISIFDLQGRKVYQKKNFSGNTLRVSIPESVYILYVSGKNQLYKYKMVVTH